MIGVALFVVGAVGGGCTVHHVRHLSAPDLRACRIGGGYEDSGGFGERFCQHDYADAGRACRSRKDCVGGCVSDLPENGAFLLLGTPSNGKCEAHSSTFGCRSYIDDGKIVGGGCDD